MAKLVETVDLQTNFYTYEGVVKALNGVSIVVESRVNLRVGRRERLRQKRHGALNYAHHSGARQNRKR